MSGPEPVFDLNDPSIPRLGQRIDFGGWSIAVSAVCRCAANQPLQLNLASTPDVTKTLPGAVVTCPRCGARWRLGPQTKVAIDVQIVALASEGVPQA